MDKKPLIHLGTILCLILLLNIAIPSYGESKKIDCGENTKSISSDRAIYFFLFAFVSGEYENCWKFINAFEIRNPDFTNTINVIGYSGYKGKFISVKAYLVDGSFRIGFIGRHHCNIFAFGPGGVTVEA